MDDDAVDDDNDDEYGDKEAITQHMCLQIVQINDSWSNNDVTPHLYLCRDVRPFNASDDRPHNRPGDYNSSETSPPKVLKKVPQRMADKPNDFQELKI